ncbi:coilin-like [Ylistrum balloti]|uniref:coilin-like n=1 Tax=Ylistrum balloti TaxID=509963 RepID=UPI002905AF5B|nr:coilin-like [Ylistrum balloti]
MSASMVEKHVRIRVFFENSSQAPIWLLVDYESMHTIQDLENEIRHRYFENTNSFVLSLDGCVLPKSEKAVILRDNDRVVVRPRQVGKEEYLPDLPDPGPGESSCTKSLPDASVSFVQEKRVVSPDFDNAEKSKEADLTQNKIKKKKRKESRPDVCQKKKKKTVSPDCNNEKETEDQNASIQHKMRKKKRKQDEIEETPGTESQLNSHKKKCKQIVETKESQPPETSCLSEQTPSLGNSKEKKTVEDAVLDNSKRNKMKVKEKKCSRESVSSETSNNVPQNSSMMTDINAPPVSKKKQDSLTCQEMEDNGMVNEDELQEEKCLKKRRRRRRKPNEKFIEEKTDEISYKNKKSFDRKKEFHPKVTRNVIDMSRNSNNHKVFNDSESEEDTHTTNKSVTGMEGTKASVEEQQESLQQAKKKLLQKVEQEYKSMTHSSDIADGHLITNQLPCQSVQGPSNNPPAHEYDQLQHPVNKDDHVSTGLSKIQLQLTALANGVPVYTRQKQKRYFNAGFGKELSKEQQLNTDLTNMSFVIFNDKAAAVQKPDKEVTCEGQPQTLIQPQIQDYTKFPPLQGTPRQGDKIAYKILELSDSYTPEVSKYKEGVVLNFDHNSQLIEIETKPESDSRLQGKFDLNCDEDNIHTETKQSLPWKSLMETRLLDIL